MCQADGPVVTAADINNLWSAVCLKNELPAGDWIPERESLQTAAHCVHTATCSLSSAQQGFTAVQKTAEESAAEESSHERMQYI